MKAAWTHTPKLAKQCSRPCHIAYRCARYKPRKVFLLCSDVLHVYFCKAAFNILAWIEYSTLWSAFFTTEAGKFLWILLAVYIKHQILLSFDLCISARKKNWHQTFYSRREIWCKSVQAVWLIAGSNVLGCFAAAFLVSKENNYRQLPALFVVTLSACMFYVQNFQQGTCSQTSLHTHLMLSWLKPDVRWAPWAVKSPIVLTGTFTLPYQHLPILTQKPAPAS